jgi:hypothetical protein
VKWAICKTCIVVPWLLLGLVDQANCHQTNSLKMCSPVMRGGEMPLRVLALSDQGEMNMMKPLPSATLIRGRRSKEADCPRILKGGQKGHPGIIIGMAVRIRKMGLAEGAVLNANSMTRLKKEDGEAVEFLVRSPSSMCANIFEPGKSASKIRDCTETGLPKPGNFYFNTRYNRIPCAEIPVVPSAAADYVQSRCLHLRSSPL